VPYTDRLLTCRECGANFTFSAGEQTFFASRGLINSPSRCPGCRNARKDGGERVENSYVNYGPFASFGGRKPRQMHPASCTACGQMTEVPFVPRADRPVLCTECFIASRGAGGGRQLSASASRLTAFRHPSTLNQQPNTTTKGDDGDEYGTVAPYSESRTVQAGHETPARKSLPSRRPKPTCRT